MLRVFIGGAGSRSGFSELQPGLGFRNQGPSVLEQQSQGLGLGA